VKKQQESDRDQGQATNSNDEQDGDETNKDKMIKLSQRIKATRKCQKLKIAARARER
jgi:hypothetical protein